jgi:ubiquinone/menaquinone biosynthesis C-methylase UbiE
MFRRYLLNHQKSSYIMVMNTDTSLDGLTEQMKRDWNERAKEDAKWFINCVKRGQTEEEFDNNGRAEVDLLVRADLPILVGGRDPGSLRALEIGCGIGRLTKHLAGIFGEVYGTDVSSEMILQGRERLRSYPNIHLHETNGSDFAGVPDEYFDFIISAFVFQHVPSKEIILSNIREAYRLLKPDSIFKFIVCGVMNEGLMQIQKDTWLGASLSEQEIRQTARELGARLIGLNGAGTQYCWILLRKPPREVKRELREPQRPPSIICIGRSDDMRIDEIPSRGEKACVGLFFNGLDRDEIDTNNLIIKLRDKDIQPCYAGVLGDGSTTNLQVNFRIPEDDPGGNASVRLQMIGGEASEAVTINILPPQPVPPKIQEITNTVDHGHDVYARGPKSRIKVLTEWLNGSANIENISVRVGAYTFKPESVSFVPANGIWEVKAPLPETTLPGDSKIHITFNGLESEAVTLHIKEYEQAPIEREPRTPKSLIRRLILKLSSRL